MGLDQSTRQKHFYNYIDRKVNIGVLEYEGVAEVHSKAFEWNQKYGNGISWRNEPLYYEQWSRHATQVSELIAGKKGIMPTLGIVSVEVNLYWNGLSGEFNYLLKHTNIVNNSWNIWKQFTLFLSFLPGYLDALIFENPELINVIAAGNQYNKNSKEIFGLTLSKNSIIVGATSDVNLEQKSNYSQIGNDSNYISVVVPGGEYTFTDESIHDGKKTGFQNRGTSFSAPVVTVIAGMLKQKYPHKFDLGSDQSSSNLH